MSALFCLFLCFGSYSEKLEEYIPTFYKIRYILEELYVAVMRIISWLIIHITSTYNSSRMYLILLDIGIYSSSLWEYDLKHKKRQTSALIT